MVRYICGQQFWCGRKDYIPLYPLALATHARLYILILDISFLCNQEPNDYYDDNQSKNMWIQKGIPGQAHHRVHLDLDISNTPPPIKTWTVQFLSIQYGVLFLLLRWWRYNFQKEIWNMLNGTLLLSAHITTQTWFTIAHPWCTLYHLHQQCYYWFSILA